MRAVALVIHRYVGLLIATFLLLAGLTGSLIAFYVPIDAALNPDLFRATPQAAATFLDPFVLRDKLQAQLPQKKLAGVILHRQAGESVNYWIDGREVFVDPYTGQVLGSRTWGDIREGRRNLLPFIYRLHFSLALDDVGMWIFGGVALLWTIDCFVGAYLTFPLPARRDKKARGKSWFSRWLPAWLLKTSKLFTLIFTWHRASGLWVWMLLLVFAWSAVALNLGEQVYEPVMSTFFGKEPDEEPAQLDKPRNTPSISLREAHAVARRLMAEEAVLQGFRVLGERTLDYDPEHGVYAYTIESTLDISERLAETTLSFDGNTGKRVAFSARTGQHAGSSVTSWLIALHFGAVRAFGIAYRCFVSVLGLMVALLSVSGVWIWWKKRAGRTRKKQRP